MRSSGDVSTRYNHGRLLLVLMIHPLVQVHHRCAADVLLVPSSADEYLNSTSSLTTTSAATE